MSKSFFVVVPFNPAIINASNNPVEGLFGKKKEKAEVAADDAAQFEENRTQLEQRVSVVSQGLIRVGVRVVQLGTEEVIELFYKLFNPGELDKPVKI
jgi:hypothetical protein